MHSPLFVQIRLHLGHMASSSLLVHPHTGRPWSVSLHSQFRVTSEVLHPACHLPTCGAVGVPLVFELPPDGETTDAGLCAGMLDATTVDGVADTTAVLSSQSSLSSSCWPLV